MKNRDFFYELASRIFNPVLVSPALIGMAENEGLGLPNRHYLLIAVPKPRHHGFNETDPVEAIDRATMGQNRLVIEKFIWKVPPELRVGTMDALYTLLDDLSKNDIYIEGVLRKIGRQRLDITKKEARKEVQFMITQNGMLPISSILPYHLPCFHHSMKASFGSCVSVCFSNPCPSTSSCSWDLNY